MSTHSLKTEQSLLRELPLEKYRQWPQSLQHSVFFLYRPTLTINDLLMLIKFSQSKGGFSPLIVRCDTHHDLQVFFEIIKILLIPTRLTLLEVYFMIPRPFFFPSNLPSKDSKTAQIK